MKVTVERAQLLKSLGHVHRVVERRNTIPILGNVLVRAENSRLSLKARLIVPLAAGALGEAAETVTAPRPRATKTRSACTLTRSSPPTALPTGIVGSMRMPSPALSTGRVRQARDGARACCGGCVAGGCPLRWLTG